METPNTFHDEKSTLQSHKISKKTKRKRLNLLAPILLALPVIFIIIALTKVLASEEYVSEPLEREGISWKIPVDSVTSQTDSTE